MFTHNTNTIRIISLGLLLVCLHFFVIHTVSAHSGGPPYVLIDKIPAPSNPLASITRPANFVVSGDLADTKHEYLVNQAHTFAVDLQYVPNEYGLIGYLPPDRTLTFRWTFGDHSAAVEGEEVTHTFDQPGSYIIALEIDYGNAKKDFRLIDTVQLNILPDVTYKLPKAAIRINGELITSPTTQTPPVLLGDVVFDAGESQGNGLKYMWDFGDGEKGEGKKVKHAYASKDFINLIPVLRVIDENRLVDDTYVYLNFSVKMNWWQTLKYRIHNFFL